MTVYHIILYGVRLLLNTVGLIVNYIILGYNYIILYYVKLHYTISCNIRLGWTWCQRCIAPLQVSEIPSSCGPARSPGRTKGPSQDPPLGGSERQIPRFWARILLWCRLRNPEGYLLLILLWCRFGNPKGYLLFGSA